MKGDTQVVLAAVKSFGCALAHASGEMKGDKQVVFAVVDECGYAFANASEQMKRDMDVMLIVAAGVGFYKASPALFNDLHKDISFVTSLINSGICSVEDAFIFCL